MPTEKKESPTFMEKILPGFDANLNFDLVERTKGIVVDTYRDTNGNSLEDGPLAFDSITCSNGAQPTAAQVNRALKELKAADPVSPSSNLLAFEDTNPIQKVCSIAPRPGNRR
jgi:hypothetical protein